MKECYPVDIRALFASKSPKLAAKLPQWLINYITKVTCIEDVNYLMNRYQNDSPFDFAGRVIDYSGANYKIIGAENIPNERCLFVSNHPLGGLDGLILIRALGASSNRVTKLIVNDLLMHITPLSPLFIPVNKHGRQSAEYSNLMEDAYKSDCNLVTFPAGLCSRLINGKIQDTEWKKSFAVKATANNRTIVPVYFNGRNSMKFYRIAQIRKALHIKFNIEMLLLPHEMFYPKCKEITIHIGKPLNVAEGAKIQDIIKEAREAVYAMAK